MRILLVTGRPPYAPFDGGSIRVFRLAQEWRQRHELALLTPLFGSEDPAAVHDAARQMGAALHMARVTLASKTRRGLDFAGGLAQGRLLVDYYPEVTAALAGLLRRQAFDVVEWEGSGGGFYRDALEAAPRRPREVLVFYDVMWQWWRRAFAGRPRPAALARWLTYRRWEPRFAQQASACVCLSPVDAKLITGACRPKRLLIVPNGIDCPQQTTPVPATTEALFVGAFSHPPNRQAAEWLIRQVWPAVRGRIPHARLTLAGRNPDPALVKLAHDAGAELVADAPDLSPLYARARVVLAPIRAGSGIRVKILEALAHGRPVVTTTLGAEGLPLTPGEHVLFADTVADIADAVEHVSNDDALAQALAAAGRALVEHEFTWPAQARRQEQAFYD